MRIVARVEHAGDVAIQGVKFFVNGAPVGQDTDGPVYAVDWVDDNPFAPTVITAEVTDAKGRSATARVDLAAFDFVEQAEVISVLVEATVHDKTGRPIAGLDKSGFILEEDGARQQLEVVRPEVMPATYVMLVDSSQSIAHGVGFLRDAVTRFMRYLRPDDRVLVVPFSRTLGAATGPTNDVETVLDALLAVHPGGGTAIYDAIVEHVRDDPQARGPARARPAQRRLRRAQRGDARRRHPGRAGLGRDRLRRSASAASPASR